MAKLEGVETRTRRVKTFKCCWTIAQLDSDETRTRKMLLDAGRRWQSWKVTKRNLVVVITRHHRGCLPKNYTRPPCGPSFVKSWMFRATNTFGTLSTNILCPCMYTPKNARVLCPVYKLRGYLPFPHGWPLNRGSTVFPLQNNAITTSRKQSDELYAFHQTYSGIFSAGSTFITFVYFVSWVP